MTNYPITWYSEVHQQVLRVNGTWRLEVGCNVMIADPTCISCTGTALTVSWCLYPNYHQCEEEIGLSSVKKAPSSASCLL